MYTSKNLSFKSSINFYLLAVLLLTLALITVRCDENDDDEDTVLPKIQLSTNATLGSYLTDSTGRTLYVFTRDVAGTNNCTGGCANLWPVFYAPNLTQVSLGAGLDLVDFGTITTAAGVSQTTYKGWPLYYYAPVANGVNTPELAGETKGENFNNVWFVGKNYTAMIGNASLLNKSTQQTAAQKYFVVEKGLTLYIFAKDQKNPTTLATNCTGGCINAWPVYYRENPVLPSSFNKADFGSITRNDGPNGTTRLQATYKGNPLYYFAQDANTRGKAEGNGFTGAGDLWFVVTP
jgi:predicted lipoprotein with Yx(FWY)xxD motif